MTSGGVIVMRVTRVVVDCVTVKREQWKKFDKNSYDEISFVLMTKTHRSSESVLCVCRRRATHTRTKLQRIEMKKKAQGNKRERERERENTFHN